MFSVSSGGQSMTYFPLCLQKKRKRLKMRKKKTLRTKKKTRKKMRQRKTLANSLPPLPLYRQRYPFITDEHLHLWQSTSSFPTPKSPCPLPPGIKARHHHKVVEGLGKGGVHHGRPVVQQGEALQGKAAVLPTYIAYRPTYLHTEQNGCDCMLLQNFII